MSDHIGAAAPPPSISLKRPIVLLVLLSVGPIAEDRVDWPEVVVPSELVLGWDLWLDREPVGAPATEKLRWAAHECETGVPFSTSTSILPGDGHNNRRGLRKEAGEDTWRIDSGLCAFSGTVGCFRSDW